MNDDERCHRESYWGFAITVSYWYLMVCQCNKGTLASKQISLVNTNQEAKTREGVGFMGRLINIK